MAKTSSRKQNKGDAPNPHSVANRDVMQRLNFLYQASVYLNSVSSPVEQDLPERQAQVTRNAGDQTVADLSRIYVATMKTIGQKTVVRMDPSIKRTICKGCSVVLIPGSTATVRVKSSSSHGRVITYTCTSCKTIRRIPAPPVLHQELEEQDSHPESSRMADINMDTAPRDDSRNPSQSRKKPKPRSIPRRQPFFEQPCHIIFCGNEQITEKSTTSK